MDIVSKCLGVPWLRPKPREAVLHFLSGVDLFVSLPTVESMFDKSLAC